MRLPVVDRLSRVPVPGFVRAAATPALETVTSYAVTAGRLLDQLVTEAIAEVVLRVDLDATIERVDLDAVVQRVDIEAVLDRLDLTETVLTRVDLDAVVGEVLTRVDEKDIAALAAKVDVDTVARRLDIEAVLDRLDLTATVVNRVDFEALVDSVLAEVDMARIVSQVLDEIELPVLIRESTGTMASDTVQTVRLRGVNADEAVNRLAARLRLRRRATPPGLAPE